MTIKNELYHTLEELQKEYRERFEEIGPRKRDHLYAINAVLSGDHYDPVDVLRKHYPSTYALVQKRAKSPVNS